MTRILFFIGILLLESAPNLAQASHPEFQRVYRRLNKIVEKFEYFGKARRFQKTPHLSADMLRVSPVDDLRVLLKKEGPQLNDFQFMMILDIFLSRALSLSEVVSPELVESLKELKQECQKHSFYSKEINEWTTMPMMVFHSLVMQRERMSDLSKEESAAILAYRQIYTTYWSKNLSPTRDQFESPVRLERDLLKKINLADIQPLNEKEFKKLESDVRSIGEQLGAWSGTPGLNAETNPNYTLRFFSFSSELRRQLNPALNRMTTDQFLKLGRTFAQALAEDEYEGNFEPLIPSLEYFRFASRRFSFSESDAKLHFSEPLKNLAPGSAFQVNPEYSQIIMSSYKKLIDPEEWGSPFRTNTTYADRIKINPVLFKSSALTFLNSYLKDLETGAQLVEGEFPTVLGKEVFINSIIKRVFATRNVLEMNVTDYESLLKAEIHSTVGDAFELGLERFRKQMEKSWEIHLHECSDYLGLINNAWIN